MSPYRPLEELRRIPGLENAPYPDPKAGGRRKSVRFPALTPHGPRLRVEGFISLFCAGESAGCWWDTPKAIITGTLAGYNAARVARGLLPLTLPTQLVAGDCIAYTTAASDTFYGEEQSFTFAGPVYFECVQRLGWYIKANPAIVERVREPGVSRVFAMGGGCPPATVTDRPGPGDGQLWPSYLVASNGLPPTRTGARARRRLRRRRRGHGGERGEFASYHTRPVRRRSLPAKLPCSSLRHRAGSRFPRTWPPRPSSPIRWPGARCRRRGRS